MEMIVLIYMVSSIFPLVDSALQLNLFKGFWSYVIYGLLNGILVLFMIYKNIVQAKKCSALNEDVKRAGRAADAQGVDAGWRVF